MDTEDLEAGHAAEEGMLMAVDEARIVLQADDSTMFDFTGSITKHEVTSTVFTNQRQRHSWLKEKVPGFCAGSGAEDAA